MTEPTSNPDLKKQASTQSELPLLEEKKPASPQKNGAFRKLSWSFLVLALIISVIYITQLMTELSSRVAKTQATITKLSSENKTLNETLNSSSLKIEALQNNVNELNQLVSNGASNWQLLETLHLLRLANLTLDFEKNPEGALALLQLANQQLFNLADPRLNPIRQALINNITTLQAIKSVDISGIYMQLTALCNQAVSIPLINRQYHANISQDISPAHKAVPWWQQSLMNAKSALSQVIIVRRQNTELQPLLSQAQNQLLRQNLYWLFGQAKWGLLHQQQTIYQQSLNQIIALLQTYLVFNQQTSSMINTLNQLAELNIAPSLPNLSDLVAAFEQYNTTTNTNEIKKMPSTKNEPEDDSPIATPNQNNSGNASQTSTAPINHEPEQQSKPNNKEVLTNTRSDQNNNQQEVWV